jgi:hypothetical protein
MKMTTVSFSKAKAKHFSAPVNWKTENERHVISKGKALATTMTLKMKKIKLMFWGVNDTPPLSCIIRLFDKKITELSPHCNLVDERS